MRNQPCLAWSRYLVSLFVPSLLDNLLELSCSNPTKIESNECKINSTRFHLKVVLCNLHPAQLSGRVGEILKEKNPNLIIRFRSYLFYEWFRFLVQILRNISFSIALGLKKYSHSSSGLEKSVLSSGPETSLKSISSSSGLGLEKYMDSGFSLEKSLKSINL